MLVSKNLFSIFIAVIMIFY